MNIQKFQNRDEVAALVQVTIPRGRPSGSEGEKREARITFGAHSFPKEGSRGPRSCPVGGKEEEAYNTYRSCTVVSSQPFPF